MLMIQHYVKTHEMHLQKKKTARPFFELGFLQHIMSSAPPQLHVCTAVLKMWPDAEVKVDTNDIVPNVVLPLV